jgi:hypothetical protein
MGAAPALFHMIYYYYYYYCYMITPQQADEISTPRLYNKYNTTGCVVEELAWGGCRLSLFRRVVQGFAG